MSKDTTAAATEKTIVSTSIYKINAERKIMCGPPAIWEVEVAIDVYFSDGTFETQYISEVDLGECGIEVTKKSYADLQDNEDMDDFTIASFDTKKEAMASPYADSIKVFCSLFNKIAKI